MNFAKYFNKHEKTQKKLAKMFGFIESVHRKEKLNGIFQNKRYNVV